MVRERLAIDVFYVTDDGVVRGPPVDWAEHMTEVLFSTGDVRHPESVVNIDRVWDRIRAHAGEEFRTVTGLPFSYVVPGNYLRVLRNGREINRSLSRTNFAKAVEEMPAARPSDIKDRQGSAYTWAILTDPRIRGRDWE